MATTPFRYKHNTIILIIRNTCTHFFAKSTPPYKNKKASAKGVKGNAKNVYYVLRMDIKKGDP
jgi:hypothetical protein